MNSRAGASVPADRAAEPRPSPFSSFVSGTQRSSLKRACQLASGAEIVHALKGRSNSFSSIATCRKSLCGAFSLRHYAGGDSATMVGIDSEGFDLLKSNKKARFFFETPISNTDEARQALIAMAKRPA